MPVSILSCNLDRTTTDLCTLSTDVANGVTGRYKVRYNVQMQSHCGPLNVLTQAAASGSPDPVPAMWATYAFDGDTDSKSFAKSFSVERDPKAIARYYVTVNYSPAEPGELPDGGGDPINATVIPTSRSPVYWWDREVSTRIEPIDTLGYPIKTYSNNLYEELVEHERARGLLVAEFNVLTQGVVIDLSRTFDQAVNSTTWNFRGRSIPPRSAMIREVSSGPPLTEGSYTYVRASMRIAFADTGKTWDTPMPEMSTSYFTKTSGQYDLNPDGTRKRTDSTSPVPLNADGTRRTDDQPILITNWRVRREVDFNTLQTYHIS